MMTLTASPKTTTRKPSTVTLTRRTEAAPETQNRPSFWRTLLRALAAPAF